MTPRILVTAPTLDPAGQRLLDGAGVETYHAKPDEELERVVAKWEPHGIISRTRALPEAVIGAGMNLQAIVKHGAGVNNIDLAAASDRGIPVFSTPGANSLAVAEYTIALMFAVVRHIPRFDRDVRAGSWDRPGDGRQLAGMNLGLVGYGRIARRVARVAGCIGMRVAAYDPFVDRDAARRAGVEMCGSLDELLAHADMLSLHCPAERGAPPLIDAARIALLPRGAFVVNTARGELIDEDALAAALEN
ncbi:D-3-phosphoglycerate dehydrogenase [Mesorhizobium sp. J18]|uniref:NAD(P)-dependent oxidoreductase n=1 Tax=Mesorhizobium sp. J18 TaxID=935263 RepID=UPI00119B30D5|nr:NAD(P)-dependent oxidoreductase [Mesorhizobium sp. J18]TWG89356.1 D-3-phosphoglycerate dehydrogenase [Mesorhizobium sp. J18]